MMGFRLALMAAAWAAAAAAASAGGAPAAPGWQRAANASAALPGLRSKHVSALVAAPQIRRLQAGGDASRLLAFKESGNGAGLESWAAGSEPCGAGWNSWSSGWRGVVCDAEGGSVERMCAPRPFLACVLHRLSELSSCRWAADASPQAASPG
eukprot:COSAG04_NODE_491_length_13463_cov_5.877432_10_plen_153_part_00